MATYEQKNIITRLIRKGCLARINLEQWKKLTRIQADELIAIGMEYED